MKTRLSARVLHRVAIGVVLAVAAVSWGSHLTRGAPFVYHPDEPATMARAIHVAESGDLNPHWFRYPSLYIMVQANVAALLHSVADVPLTPGGELLFEGAPLVALPHYVAGRVVTLLFALGTTCLVIQLARELTNRWLALLAGVAFATSGLVFRSAIYVTVDMPLTFFVTLSTYLMCRAAPAWSIAVTGALAAGMKYNGALVLLVLPGVLVARRGVTRRVALELLACAALAIVVFLATTPYALLDWDRFWDREHGLTAELIHYSSGHYGADRGASSAKLLQTLLFGVSPLVALAPLAIFDARRERRVWLVLAVFAVLGAPVALAKVYFERNCLPLAPLALVLACSSLHAGLLRLRRQSQVAVGVAVAGVQAITGGRMLGSYIAELGYEDARTLAHRWAVRNMPRGSRVLREAFTPQLHLVQKLAVTSRFTVGATPVSEIENDFDYVVTSAAMWAAAPDIGKTSYPWLFSRPPVFEVRPPHAHVFGDFPTIRIHALVRPLPKDLEPFTVFRVSEDDGFGDILPVNDVVLEAPESGRKGPLVVRSLGRDPSLLLPELPRLSSKSYVLRVSLTVPTKTKLQVFYLTPSLLHYEEEKSVFRMLVPGKNEFDLRIGADALSGRLRLDPGDQRDVYTIHFIALYALT